MIFGKAVRRIAVITITVILLNITICGTAAVIAESNKNLVRGLSYTIETGEPVMNSYGNFENDFYGINTGQLTDGVTAMTDYNSDAWYRSMRGGSRIICFDLGGLKSISGFYAGFLHIKSMAIYAPRYVKLSLSENGEDFETVSNLKPGYDISDPMTRRADFNDTFDKAYKAKYVKVEFCSDIYTYCDEIRVLGSDTLTGNERSITPDTPKKEPGFLRDLKGKSDIIKIYNGYYENQDIADNTPEELLPYIAYVNTDGSYTDTMFDSLAFVPCHTDYPSGGRLVKTNDKNGAVMSDWLLYLDNTFKEGVNTDALDIVVGQVYSKLGIKEKFTVYFTLPFPTVIDEPFGDIDGDGEEEYCSTLEERTEILKWYVNLTYDRFREGDYKNLTFGGFYWYREEINYSETDHEADLVINISDYIKKKRFGFIFDPFYLSTGYDHWKELRFSAAVMQPNLIFRDYFEHEMLGEFAETIKKHNLGAEIETGEPDSYKGNEYTDYGLKYEYYLYYGFQTGYMDALHTYYQGAGPGSIYDFCYAENNTRKGRYLRSLYDKTYNFIKGTYTAYAPSVFIPDFSTASGQKNVIIDMTINDPDTSLEEIKVLFTKIPEHGTVTALTSNKSIVYTANPGYSGTDSFEVVVFDKFSYSAPITVTVTVVETTASSDDSLDDSSDDIVPESSSLKSIIFITLGAFVFLAVLAFIIRKIKVKRQK